MAKKRTPAGTTTVQQGDAAPIGDSSSKTRGVTRTGMDIEAYTNPLNRRIKEGDAKRWGAPFISQKSKPSVVPVPSSFSRRNRDVTL